MGDNGYTRRKVVLAAGTIKLGVFHYTDHNYFVVERVTEGGIGREILGVFSRRDEAVTYRDQIANSKSAMAGGRDDRVPIGKTEARPEGGEQALVQADKAP